MRAAIGIMCLGTASLVSAQSVTVETVAAGPGDTGVTVNVDYVAGATDLAGFQFDIDLDAALTGAIEAGCGGDIQGTTVLGNCSSSGSTVSVNFGVFPVVPIGSTTIASFTVDVDGGVTPPANLAMTVTPIALSDTGGNSVDVNILTYNDGAITVAAGPTLDADPTSVSLAAEVGGSDSDDFTLTANGGAVAGISCSASGDSEISFAGAVPGSLADGNSATVTASCSGAAGTYNATYSCTSDASNSPTDVAVDCTVAAGTAAPAFQPENGGTLTIGGLVEGGSGSAAVTFSETNNAGTGYDVSNCSLTGDPNFSVSPTSVSVAAGGSASISVAVDDAEDGDTTTLTCDIVANGATTAYSVDVRLAFRPLIVPTMQQWGMILMGMLLAGFGLVTLRRRGDFTA
ncbi:MAG: IPTL-CTERM sorting domain-containing protein [Pseudomonadota bacterium]